MDCSTPGSSVLGIIQSLLQGIFSTQGLNSRLPHSWQILYQWATGEAHNIDYYGHIYFIHSSIDRHLECFHLLAIANDAAIIFEMDVIFSN